MTRRTSLILLFFCLLGLAVAGGSAYVHYRLLRDPGYTSFCDINTAWNCATVYESRYGAFWGVPTAVGGLAWFAVATLLAGIGMRISARPRPAKARKGAADVAPVASYLFAWSIAGLAVVLYLGYASFFVLRAYCILCLTTYVAVIGIFVTSGSASETDMRSLPARILRDLRSLVASPAALVATLAVAAGVSALVAYFPRQVETPLSAAAPAPAPAALAQAQQSEFERWYTTQPRVPIAVANDGAKVVVLKFNDYMCPPCRQTFAEYKPVLAKWQSAHPGLVKFEVRDYPLDPECNSNAPGGQHLASCEAAVAVRLAKEKGRGAEVETWLYDNQGQLTPLLVKQGVKDIGKVNDFEARYAATLELVKGDIALGAQLGVRGTPTFFVNGVRIPGLKAEFFDAAIAYELKQAGVIK
jgi:vitamin-K-epoxide reductase (warfarin-sensitive)